MSNTIIDKLVEKLKEAVDEFRGKVRVAETIGALELVKADLIKEAFDD